TGGDPDHILTNSAAISGGAAVLTADSMALGGTINVGSGAANIVTLRTSTLARPVNLDNAAGDPPGELRLSPTELNTITAGAVRIGRSDDAANLNVKSAITNPAGWNTLHLMAGANIQQAGGTLSVPNLAAQAAGVGLDSLANTVATFAGSAGTS